MREDSKIYISGHTGLLGSAICRLLKSRGFYNLIVKTKSELDLRGQAQVRDFFREEKPKFVFHCAAKVGSINANIAYPAEFLYDNLAMQANVINEAYNAKVSKLIFFSSNCAYPRECAQPMKEDFIFTGPIEPTNEAYGVAKIAGLKACSAYHKQYGADFLTLIPASLYGQGDHFNGDRSHIIPLLIHEVHNAKTLGKESVFIKSHPGKIREFIYVDDAADAAIWAMENNVEPRVINVGTREDIGMEELGTTVKEVVGFGGKIIWDTNQPAGMPKKVLSPELINNLGWRHKTSLKEGLAKEYDWFLKIIKN